MDANPDPVLGGLYPFYMNHGDGRYDLTEPEDFQELFDLPEPVMRMPSRHRLE